MRLARQARLWMPWRWTATPAQHLRPQANHRRPLTQATMSKLLALLLRPSQWPLQPGKVLQEVGRKV